MERKSITFKQLKAAVNSVDEVRHADDEVLVWLPGSTIRLGQHIFFNKKHNALLIEGNVNPGSALSQE